MSESASRHSQLPSWSWRKPAENQFSRTSKWFDPFTPREVPFFPGFWGGKIRPGHVYQAHTGYSRCDCGNHHAYSFPAHVVVSFQGLYPIGWDCMYFPECLSLPPCVCSTGWVSAIRVRSTEYNLSIIGWICEFSRVWGAAFRCRVPRSVVRHGTCER